MSITSFPEDFVWGVSTSAYQIEGATAADGRLPSIWDTFSADRAEACDHYHRYPDDVRLMKELGMAAYRFSVSWARVFPEGRGKPNAAGLDFYDRLLDEVTAAGITPYATLYHWDLPQALEDRGGWPARDTAERFAEYAAAVHDRIGDRVDTWFTLNEPWVAAFLGYGSGVHAPGRKSAADAFRAAHHMLLGHGLAVQALRAAGAEKVGLVLNIAPVMTPAQVSDFGRELSEEDAAAVARIDALANRQFLEPALRGAYPAELLPVIDRHAGLGHVREGDLETIAQPLDLLGVNYYTPLVVQAQPSEPADPAYPGSEGILFCTIPTAVTAMGWPIVPNCLSLLLGRISREYPGLDLMVTENGADFVDVVTGDGIHDVERISFIEEHLRALRAAIDDGARVRGYLVWTLLDNLEWSDGYQRKFGLVHVDFATQRRRMKDSALWYRDVIRRNGLAETRPRRPTLETVAARAGVSRATVSRVVNGESSVSPEVRTAVMRAVNELGYVPNLAARSLVTRRTNAVALVLSVPRQGADALTSAVVQYVTSLLEGAGKQITLMLADTAESHRRIAAHVEARLADGVVLLPPDRGDTLAERLSRTGVPLVLLGKPPIASLVPYVDVDNAGGAVAATEHLLARGRRRIGMVCGPTDLVTVQDRLAGHRTALQRAGLTPHLAPAGDLTRAEGAAATRRLLTEAPSLDAVFAATDQLAIGALQAARELGRRVPDDLAVVGFDDVDAASATTPALTTVRVPVADQALALARLLLSRLEGRHTTSVVLPTRLVVRESA
ncbi:Beta-glucosidase [[Actinomadura] parvosata subsp. kistnae]|uniref:Beta-glucosidase n=1 Tax=[Actinomadura] parvosata subsp. kistnae TaxID=1909395 RepID=A0A1V0A631_9ACTN|nr:GH1 family beta-glucosidase [Nonomuraea sp. ATCC 55076]AQZ65622.1 beta-glucosidase [Nonomuraea sp. ATCC 55076]SPL97004.1 Beta-glucosidase [Actinomadura parvosata subsp. kistnae]